MRVILAVPIAVLAVLALVLPVAATAQLPKANLKGTHKCADAKYAFSVRVRGLRCSRGRHIATYWETTGRGHCPKGYRTRRFHVPAGTHGVGGSYLNCHRRGGGADVFWVEGGE